MMSRYAGRPWLKSRKALCPAYTPNSYESQPRELRLQWELLHRLNVNRTIARKVAEGYKFVSVERKSGSGRVDVWVQSPNGMTEKIEVKGSRQVKGSHLLQSICYHEKGDKVIVAAVDEIVEPEEWFIEPAKVMLDEIADFVERFPDEASRTYNPTPELCPSCSRTDCPHNKR